MVICIIIVIIIAYIITRVVSKSHKNKVYGDKENDIARFNYIQGKLYKKYRENKKIREDEFCDFFRLAEKVARCKEVDLNQSFFWIILDEYDKFQYKTYKIKN